MRRALVTGGSGDIGAAICRRLAADGYYVYVHANLNLAKAVALAEEICRTGGRAEAIAFDVTDAEASRVVLEALVAESPIQILVNNAGIHDDAVFPGMSAGQWHRVLDVSLHGFFRVTQPLIMPMIRGRWGRIVNI
nr:SDR family NAD(P)-dependent oxidoreductase [Phenylobacterium sp.]